jgi:hypothetical protein
MLAPCYAYTCVFGTEFQLKNQVKYLGVILDEKLNWNSHIDHRMQKATIAFWREENHGD